MSQALARTAYLLRGNARVARVQGPQPVQGEGGTAHRRQFALQLADRWRGGPHRICRPSQHAMVCHGRRRLFACICQNC
jgi:hypothetical protein